METSRTPLIDSKGVEERADALLVGIPRCRQKLIPHDQFLSERLP